MHKCVCFFLYLDKIENGGFCTCHSVLSGNDKGCEVILRMQNSSAELQVTLMYNLPIRQVTYCSFLGRVKRKVMRIEKKLAGMYPGRKNILLMENCAFLSFFFGGGVLFSQ